MGWLPGRGADKPAQVLEARKFDLNIEEVLEGWEVRHAVREIIANALDEQILTGTADMEIRQTGTQSFIVRDRGRGIRPEHLTQNESVEKMSGKAPVIGRFGVGLKDALAVLNRRGAKVRISSRHCTITTELAEKHGFGDITTLHALVGPPDDVKMDGTEVLLDNVQREEMEGAKLLFRRFNNNQMESFNGNTVRLREGSTRGLKTDDSAILSGLHIYHNHVRPHLGLPEHSTPGEAAGIAIRGGNRLKALIQAAAKEERNGSGPAERAV